MQFPLEIAFHNVDKSDWAEEEIRARVASLEKLYPNLTGCRIRVERRASGLRIPPVVRIEMSVPGHKDLVIAYEPDRLQKRFQNPDLHNAIHDAFSAAERRLKDFKRQREGGEVLDLHDLQNQFLGQVAEMHPEKEYGFLVNNDGGLLYFHRNSMLGGRFEDLQRGTEVHYVEEMGDTGPIATKVRIAAGHSR